MGRHLSLPQSIILGCTWCKIGTQGMSQIDPPMVTAHINHFFNRAQLRVIKRKLCTSLISTMTDSLAALTSLPTGAFSFSLFQTCYFLNSPLCFLRWRRRLRSRETTSALLSSPAPCTTTLVSIPFVSVMSRFHLVD